jgi:hypothetical protein
MISCTLRVLAMIWFAAPMTWRKDHPKIAAFYYHPTTQKAKAILEDTGLVILIILCFKLVGVVMYWTGASAELYGKFILLKDYVFLALYLALSIQLLDKFGLFALIVRLYTWLKGVNHGSGAIMAA